MFCSAPPCHTGTASTVRRPPAAAHPSCHHIPLSCLLCTLNVPCRSVVCNTSPCACRCPLWSLLEILSLHSSKRSAEHVDVSWSVNTQMTRHGAARPSALGSALPHPGTTTKYILPNSALASIAGTAAQIPKNSQPEVAQLSQAAQICADSAGMLLPNSGFCQLLLNAAASWNSGKQGGASRANLLQGQGQAEVWRAQGVS